MCILYDFQQRLPVFGHKKYQTLPMPILEEADTTVHSAPASLKQCKYQFRYLIAMWQTYASNNERLFSLLYRILNYCFCTKMVSCYFVQLLSDTECTHRLFISVLEELIIRIGNFEQYTCTVNF
jgi:hypothetical protein